MIIFNSSPLIHLSKIGKMEFLFKIFDFIIIPEAVYSEVIEAGLNAGYSEAILLLNYYNSKKILKMKITTPDPILKGYLHPGEYEAILLAQELNALLVIDDKKGRTVAEQKRLEFLTTADIFLLLIKEKVINSTLFKLNLGKYSANAWFASNLYQKYLKEGKKYE